MSANNVWTHSHDHADLVTIGDTHRLWAHVSGPSRHSPATKQPLVIIEAGIGSSSKQYVLVHRGIAAFCRVLSYDRSGYGRSDAAPSEQVLAPEQRVKDLRGLLEATGLDPPWVFVGHSYGGTVARGFCLQVGRRGQDVIGLVMVDAGPLLVPTPDGMYELLGGAAFWDVVGISKEMKMGRDEWEAWLEDEKSEKDASTQVREWEVFVAAQREVTTRSEEVGTELMGDARMSVILGGTWLDFQKVYQRAVRLGLGTQKVREEWEGCLETNPTWRQREEVGMKSLLKLGNNTRWVVAEGKGLTHNMQFTAPEVIIDEVRWVLGMDDA